jgi:hypothetical protein
MYIYIYIYIYSFSFPTQVTAHCQGLRPPPIFELSYQAMLDGCENSTEFAIQLCTSINFKLLPHSLRRTKINVIKTHIVLPNFENILNFSEENLLRPDAIQPVELQHLGGIVERATARSFTQGIAVNKIVRAQLKCAGTR